MACPRVIITTKVILTIIACVLFHGVNCIKFISIHDSNNNNFGNLLKQKTLFR